VWRSKGSRQLGAGQTGYSKEVGEAGQLDAHMAVSFLFGLQQFCWPAEIPGYLHFI